MTIRYNSDAAIKAFERHLAKTLQVIQHELLADAKAGMRTPEGRRDLYASVVAAVAGIVTGQITGGPHALLDEWGKGSLMDPENPALNEYRNSPYWNPARRDLAIRGRPPGAYTDMFGRHRVSSGRAKGYNLEQMVLRKTPKGNLDPNDFLPQYPSHAVQIAFRWMAQERFRWYLQRALDTFPWGKYLKVTNTKG
jgi:hypothetical protein